MTGLNDVSGGIPASLPVNFLHPGQVHLRGSPVLTD